MPSVYCLYNHKTDSFFIETSEEAFRQLKEKYPEAKYPGEFKVRFTKLLTPIAIDDLYKATILRGQFHKNLNEFVQWNLPAALTKG